MAERFRLRCYEDWRRCMTELCGIPLTSDYVEARIRGLDDSLTHDTRRFVQLRGEAHLTPVRAWFRQARYDLVARDSA